jgi:hypothetical protein
MTGPDASCDGLTVADAMVGQPKLFPLAATVGDVRRFFRDDHVHAALIVTQAECLAAVVERCDISGSPAPDDARAAPFGRLAGRVVMPGASLRVAWLAMTATGKRRNAVISANGRLLGLLCLKASHAGFCSDEDVVARAGELKARPTG